MTTRLGGRERDVLHPSRQVGNYKRYLQDVHTTFSEGTVGLEACSFLHNMAFVPTPLLFDTRFGTLLQHYPAYTGNQADELATYLANSLAGGDGLPVLDQVLKGRYHPRDQPERAPSTGGGYLAATREAEDERRMIEAYRRIPEDAAEREALTRLAAESWPT